MSELSVGAVPEVTGAIDRDYLAAALARAGLPAPEASPTSEKLTGGRTSAQVLRLTAGDRSYVLKQIPAGSWRTDGMRCPEGGEPRLWLDGPVRRLPGRVRWPVLDVAFETGRDLYWVLMEDVGDGIRERGKFTRDDTRTLIRALAEMQPPFYETDALSGAPLPRVVDTVRVFSEPLLHLTGKRTSDEPWVVEMLEAFQLMGAFAPPFLEVLGPKLADDFLELCADDGWHALLDRQPAGLLHGDLRRANIAFEGDRLALVDWEFAAIGPPACDLQWHCFLHYWGYPPDGVEQGDDCDDLRDFFADELERQLGRAIDRVAFDDSWKLGWIKVMAQIGCVLIDPLYPDGGTPEVRARVGALCARAVRRALDARESLG